MTPTSTFAVLTARSGRAIRPVPAPNEASPASVPGANFYGPFKQYAPALAAAIRRWRHQDTRPMTLTVRGDGINLTIELPPNVSTRQLLRQLAPLLDKTK
jgi:hypothetical protein